MMDPNELIEEGQLSQARTNTLHTLLEVSKKVVATSDPDILSEVNHTLEDLLDEIT
jgi:hypothetical protein